MIIYKCSIYDKRPEICKEFPKVINLLLFPSCEIPCNRCGKCCEKLEFDILNLGDSFVKWQRCPYLINKLL